MVAMPRWEQEQEMVLLEELINLQACPTTKKTRKINLLPEVPREISLK